jgi:hypothetical protein
MGIPGEQSMRFMSGVKSSVVVGTALCLFAGSPLSAQEITGRIASDNGQPIPSVTLELLSAGTQVTHTVSDSAGSFTLRVTSDGTYRIRASRIGYTTLETSSFQAAAASRMLVTLTLRETVLEMTPILVEATRRRPGVPPEFARRRARAMQDGRGVFLTQEELERQWMRPLSVVLLHSARRLPHSYTTNGSFVLGEQQCSAVVFFNGVLIPEHTFATSPFDELFRPDMLSGVEIYTRQQVPLEYGGAMGPCAAVLLWSRSGDDERRPFSWVRVAIGGAGILGLLLLVVAH